MDLLKVHQQAFDHEFIARLDVAAVLIGSKNPQVWSIENAVAVAIEFNKKRSNSDETLLAAAQAVFDERGDVVYSPNP